MNLLRWNLCGTVLILLVCDSLQSHAEDDSPRIPRPGVWGLDFSPDGKWLAAATNIRDKGGPVVVWSTTDWKRRLVRFEANGGLHVAFSPDSRLFAYSTRGPLVSLLEVDTGQVVREIDTKAESIYCVTFSPDGRSLVTSGSDRAIKFWDIDAGFPTRSLVGHSDIVSGLAISPDGTTLVSSSNDRTARVWRLATGEVTASFGPRSTIVRRVAFSRDGRYFLVSSWDAKTRLHETASTRVLAVIGEVNGSSADLTPDNRYLAATGHDGMNVYELNLSPATEQQSQQIHKLIARFADDDYHIREEASAEVVKFGLPAEPLLREAMQSEDAEVRIRSRRTRGQVISPEPILKLPGHSGRPEVVRFSPDGKWLATGCRGGELKIWRVPEFTEVITLYAPTRS